MRPGVLDLNLAPPLRGVVLGEQLRLSERSSAVVTGSRDTSGEKNWTDLWGVEVVRDWDKEGELSRGAAREEPELETVLSLSSSEKQSIELMFGVVVDGEMCVDISLSLLSIFSKDLSNDLCGVEGEEGDASWSL